MTEQSNTNPIDLVQPEIDSTLENCELSLGRFLEDRDSGEDLQNCIDCLNQLRGIFVVLEVEGPSKLCEEAVSLANEVPVGASEDKNVLLAKLSDAVFMLKKYTEYFANAKKDFPELLLPTINDLRMVAKKPLFPESFFYDFSAASDIDLLTTFPLDGVNPLSDFEHHAARFRHMYQVGLLDVLKGRNVEIAQRLLERASHGALRLSIGYQLAPFWALLELLAKVCAVEGLEMLDFRKRLFMRSERFLRNMAKNGVDSADAEVDKDLVNDIIFTLAISGSELAEVEKLSSQLPEAVRYDESLRVAEAKALFGPGNDVLATLASAVNEELVALKEKLDILERGAQPDADDVEFISDTLSRLGGTLMMLNMPKLAAAAQQQVESVSAWAGSDVPEDSLLETANVVLAIETSIKKFGEASSSTGDFDLDTDSEENSYLNEANILVIEESQSSLAFTKRAISAYIESNGDKMHLANVTTALDTIRGGMMLTGRMRVAGIVESCVKCIETELLSSEQFPEERLLETLADALSSLEFYVETLGRSKDANEELLKLSEESLGSIGYETV